MQRLLMGRVRFPGFTEAWREVRLGEVTRRVRRTTEYDIDAILSISAGIGFEHQVEKFGRVIAGKNLARYTLLRRGEFAYNKENSKTYPQGCIYLLDEYDEALIPNVYYSFRVVSNRMDTGFLRFYFENGALNKQLAKVINTGIRNDGLLNIDADDFFCCHILVPPLAEQKRIGAVLSDLSVEIDLLTRKLEALREQKKGLMERVLTGRVRVQA
jgi:type I restriction enzyme, S subunit